NVRIIDVATSKTLRIIPAHTGSVWAVDWSPAEDRIVTAGADGAVRLFDSEGEFRRELGSHAGTARSVAFSRDGSWIASGGADSKVRLWRATGEPGPVLSGHSSQIDGVAWHPSGQKLASASLDGTVRIWDLNGSWNANGIRGPELKGHLGGVLGLSWSFDGEVLASAGVDGTVLLWTSDGKRHSTLRGHDNAVTAITWGTKGLIATSGDDKTVRLWQRDGTLLKTRKMEVGRINDLEWSRDGSRLAIATGHQGIRFLNTDGEWDGAISLETISMRAIAFNPAGELATAGDEGFVAIWNADGTRKTQLKGHRQTVLSVSWNSSGGQLVSGSWDMPVRIWDARGNALATRNGTHPTVWNPTVDEVAWTSGPDVHVAGPDAPERVFRGHQSQVLRLSWNAHGTQLASADANGVIRVWNRDGSSAGAIQADPIVFALAWHPGKPLLASGSAGNGNIQVWGLDGNRVRTWNAHAKGITTLDYSPDGDRLFSSAYDQYVRVWNETGNVVGTFPGAMAIACTTAWNAIGRQIATAHIDGTVCLWDDSTFEPEATYVYFQDGNWARFDSRGLSNSSDATAVDGRLVVVAEDDSEAIRLVKLSEFRDRTAHQDR
ncbi:MAG TPA: WD40 repeat domain-containing protein, partial [Planctomycetaceae bacterium]|nr:WD40 repeat domain-containing protein [Planctomycetaceae bacterium]